jgi:hypothetical protein
VVPGCVKTHLRPAVRMVLLTVGLGAALIFQAITHSTVAFLVILVVAALVGLGHAAR